MPITKTVIVAAAAAFVRDRFATALQEAGHAAVALTSAAALLARLDGRTGSADLALLDLRLPPGRGVELVRALRSLEHGRVPILMFSGTVGSAAEVRELAALGISGYVNEYCAVPQILPALAPHLFPDNFDRRGSRRVLLGIPIAYRVGNTIAAAITLNLGKGGLGIRTMSPLDRETKVQARFRLPGTTTDIEAESRVPWTDRRIGMGLQFEKLDAVDQAAIDDFVDQHFGRG